MKKVALAFVFSCSSPYASPIIESTSSGENFSSGSTSDDFPEIMTIVEENTTLIDSTSTSAGHTSSAESLELCGDSKLAAWEECDPGLHFYCSKLCKWNLIAFVTSEKFSAFELNGIDGAISKCNNAANIVGIEGTFIPWLSDSKLSASDLFAKSFLSNRQVVRVDGKPIFENFAEGAENIINAFPDTNGNYSSKYLLNPINIDENGNLANSEVWTSTLTNGESDNNLCNDWHAIDKAGLASIGYSDSLTGNWTRFHYDPITNEKVQLQETYLSCTFNARIYCFQNDF